MNTRTLSPKKTLERYSPACFAAEYLHEKCVHASDCRKYSPLSELACNFTCICRSSHKVRGQKNENPRTTKRRAFVSSYATTRSTRSHAVRVRRASHVYLKSADFMNGRGEKKGQNSNSNFRGAEKAQPAGVRVRRTRQR